MNAFEIRTRSMEEIKRAWDMAAERWPEIDWEVRFPTVEFSSRLTTTAGKAYPRQMHIKLSMSIAQDNADDFIMRTPAHEAAHLIANEVYGSRIAPHGREWKGIMRWLGRDDSRCHSMKVTRRRGSRHYYDVGGKLIELGAGRHAKLQSGRATYSIRMPHGTFKIQKHNYTGESK